MRLEATGDRLYVQPDGDHRKVNRLEDALEDVDSVDKTWWTYDVPDSLENPLTNEAASKVLVVSFGGNDA